VRQPSTTGAPHEDHDPAGHAELIEVRSGEYLASLAHVRHDAYHRPGYVELEARAAAGSAVAYRYREGGRVLLVPLVLRAIPGESRWRDAVSPYGYPGPVAGREDAESGDAPAGFWDRAAAALPDTLRAAGILSCFVRVHPLLPTDLDALARAGTLVRHGGTVCLDLTRDDAELWSRTRANHRRQIGRARRAGLVSRFDDWQRLGEFVEIYHETMTRVGADRAYFFDDVYLKELRTAVEGDLHLVTIEQSSLPDGGPPAGEPGEVLGAGLFLAHDGIVQYHLGATRDRHLAWQPAKLMMDDVRRWAQSAGRTALHLGGGVGGRTDDSLFHFKAGFGTGRAVFHSWRVVCDRPAYRALASASEDDDTGFFPAYRAGAAT
jgi:Acetyltransferase (GNAT) domain